MKLRNSMRFATAAVILGGVAGLTGCGGSDSSRPTVTGATQTVYGASVSTWAKLDGSNRAQEVGFTVPIQTFQNAVQATQEANFVLDLPAAVKATTFMDHLEMGWNPHGHPGPKGPGGLYAVPHWDFHLYHMTRAQVQGVNCQDTTAPAADRVPAGYVLPPTTAPGTCVPQMGYHASPPADFAPNAAFTQTMILGYYGGSLTFIEPMVTSETLLKKQGFAMTIPTPTALGASTPTRLPTRLAATYDDSAQAYRFVFSDFVTAQ